jgi:hypothetical protein
MAKKKNTKVRFLGGYAARKDLLGILSFPVGYDGHDVEHTRFFMVTPEKWCFPSVPIRFSPLSKTPGKNGFVRITWHKPCINCMINLRDRHNDE